MSLHHTSKEYERDLQQLRGQLVAMGARCEHAVSLATAALLNRDATALVEIRAINKKVDQDEMQLDELAFQILALRQPVAYDLRFVVRTLKFVTDLERISDEAVNMGKGAVELAACPYNPPIFELPKMARIAQDMLRSSLDAFMGGDQERAKRVLEMDDEVDSLYRNTRAAVLAWLDQHPTEIRFGLCISAAAKQIERIADHATNLAEHVVFLEQGIDVRHGATVQRKPTQ